MVKPHIETLIAGAREGGPCRGQLGNVAGRVVTRIERLGGVVDEVAARRHVRERRHVPLEDVVEVEILLGAATIAGTA